MALFFEPRPARGRSSRPAVAAGAAAVDRATRAGSRGPARHGRVVARSEHVAVFLPAIRAFSTGCMLEVEIVTRQAGLPEDEWWDLRLSVHRGYRGFQGPRLPDKLLRLGVRFPDGGKATTLDRGRDGRGDEPPAGPVLSWWPGSSGTRDAGELGFNHFGLWLWPVPPTAGFEFAVEWPLGGIAETIVELDGATIAAAAARPGYYWPPG